MYWFKVHDWWPSNFVQLNILKIWPKEVIYSLPLLWCLRRFNVENLCISATFLLNKFILNFSLKLLFWKFHFNMTFALHLISNELHSTYIDYALFFYFYYIYAYSFIFTQKRSHAKAAGERESLGVGHRARESAVVLIKQFSWTDFVYYCD